ncbi:MAG TPA: exodeoxyribonuclease III [Polyangia bacterium]
MNLKIASWNVNGIRARNAEVSAYIEREAPDVICLQELKATAEQIPGSLCDLADYWWYWHGNKAYSGVALGVRKSFAPEQPAFFHPDFDMESRIVLAKLGPATVASVYVPNGGKDLAAKMKFLEAIDAFAAEAQVRNQPLILCGDFNVAHTDRDVHPKERKAGIVGQLPEERALIDRLMAHGLVDVGRTRDPDNDNLFSWWAPWRNLRQRNIGWRIDFVFASAALATRAVGYASVREFGTSDHAPQLTTFDL